MSESRVCGNEDCLFCKGDLNMDVPPFEEMDRETKDNRINCGRVVFNRELDEDDDAYRRRTIDDLIDELDTNINEEIKIRDLQTASPYNIDDKTASVFDSIGEKMDFLQHISHMVELMRLMSTRQDINRHIGWKVHGEPEQRALTR